MRVPKSTRLWLAAMGLSGVLAGCATRPPANEPAALAEYQTTNDPLEPFNRAMYAANTKIDAYSLRPAAVAYTKALPDGVRHGIHNVLANLASPVKLGNDMLEGKPRRAGDTLMRFLINTTVGGLGVFDPATNWGYPDHDSDFGVTLAIWGFGSGPYLFLPILGPGSPRDSSGRLVDIAGDPLTYFGQGAVVTAANTSHFVVNLVDARAQYLGTFSQIRSTALDPYATFRSLYRQHRDAQLEQIRADNQRTIPVWFPPTASAPPPAPSTPASAPAPAVIRPATVPTTIR